MATFPPTFKVALIQLHPKVTLASHFLCEQFCLTVNCLRSHSSQKPTSKPHRSTSKKRQQLERVSPSFRSTT